MTVEADSLMDRLRRVLEPLERDQVSFAWIRRQLANPDVPTDELTPVMRILGWRQSFMCQRNGRPKHYWRESMPHPPRPHDTPETRAELLAIPAYQRGEPWQRTQRRVQLRAIAWKGNAPATLAELETLPPYQMGEPRALTQRRTVVKAAIAEAKRIELRTAMGDTPENRAELATLPPYQRGEPHDLTLRRARLKRATREVKRGLYKPTALPTDLGLAALELAALGTYCLGESGYVSRRRAALTRLTNGRG